MSDPDIAVRRLKGQDISGDGGPRRRPGESHAVGLNITGKQITRSVHIYITAETSDHRHSYSDREMTEQKLDEERMYSSDSIINS